MKKRGVGRSGYKGVMYDVRRSEGLNPYQAILWFRKNDKVVKYSIGSYETAELAYIARIKFIDSLK